MNIEQIKDLIDALVAWIKEAMATMTWFINGWKTKDHFDDTVTE